MTIQESQSDRAKAPTAKRFTMRGTPLLSQGTTNAVLAVAENLWLAAKVYCGGGENSLHYHSVEDHAFVVMQGHATFHFGDGSSCEVDAYDGVMLPKGAVYRFVAAEDENLIMLRIGAAQRKNTGIDRLNKIGQPMELDGTAMDADGSVKVSRSGPAKTPNPPAIVVQGKFFPAPR